MTDEDETTVILIGFYTTYSQMTVIVTAFTTTTFRFTSIFGFYKICIIFLKYPIK